MNSLFSIHFLFFKNPINRAQRNCTGELRWLIRTCLRPTIIWGATSSFRYDSFLPSILFFSQIKQTERNQICIGERTSLRPTMNWRATSLLRYDLLLYIFLILQNVFWLTSQYTHYFVVHVLYTKRNHVRIVCVFEAYDSLGGHLLVQIIYDSFLVLSSSYRTCLRV